MRVSAWNPRYLKSTSVLRGRLRPLAQSEDAQGFRVQLFIGLNRTTEMPTSADTVFNLSSFVRPQSASRRLVVMTPFIDADGFRWLRRVFEATRADCEKIVVLRNTDQYTVELGVQHADWLHALQVSVRDYHLSHAAATGRALPIETFHAKLIVADDTLAYVGSANLLNSSEGLSLETGLLVEGSAAVQVARLVDAVLRVARSLS
jgi:hypothetical protein